MSERAPIPDGTVSPETNILLNYLRASGLQVGLVLNFGGSAQFKRIVNTTRRLPQSGETTTGANKRIAPGDLAGSPRADSDPL